MGRAKKMKPLPRRPKPPFLCSDRDRHGTLRWYVRRPGHPKIRIREEYGTDPFWAAYRDGLIGIQGLKPGRVDRQPPAEGTLHALCVSYFESGDFKILDEKTRKVRRSILERLCQECLPSGKMYGELPYKSLKPQHLIAMRDQKVSTPGAANSMLKALRRLFAFAISYGHLDGNPARDVPYFPPVRADGIPAWPQEAVDQFAAYHPAGTMARLALLLFCDFGQRISDIHRLGPGMVRDGEVHFTQWKNRNRKPVTLRLPISDEMNLVLSNLPADRKTFLVTDYGRPFASVNAFGNKFRDWCQQAGLEGLSSHGLRKYFSAKMAENEATDRQIMAFTGHRTSKEIDRYTKSAEQARLARGAQNKRSRPFTVPPSCTNGKSGT